MKGTVIFRADGNASIGSGHIMRCLSIADSWSVQGYCCVFVTAGDEFHQTIASRGFDNTVLHSQFNHMEDELDEFIEIINKYRPVSTFVDSYFVTGHYLRELQKAVQELENSRLVYLDDIAAFPYPCDVLINYNAYGEDIDYQNLYKDSNVPLPYLILGSSYAPLRSMFFHIPKRKQPERVANVLISTGGSDELHLAVTLASCLVEAGDTTGISYHFLLGPLNKDKEKIYSLTSKDNYIVLHENVTDMKSLISSCDIAISAAGSTMYEIAACGVPLITYSLADNQIPGGQAFERIGLGMYIGDLRSPDSIHNNTVISGQLSLDAVIRIMSAMDELANDYDLRVTMGKKMQSLIDGYGADRLVKAIEDR